MNLNFKAALMRGWTLLDDRILVGSKQILLSSITEMKHEAPGRTGNGVIQVFYPSAGLGFSTLAYPRKQANEGLQAALYIYEHMPDAAKRGAASAAR